MPTQEAVRNEVLARFDGIADGLAADVGAAESAGGRMTMRQCLVGKDDLQLDDNWDVLGMRGTGSMDFAAEDVFVPAELTYEAQCAPLRGGRQYRTGVAGYLGYTIPAVAAGAARRALDEVVAGAAGSVRGYRTPKPPADNRRSTLSWARQTRS